MCFRPCQLFRRRKATKKSSRAKEIVIVEGQEAQPSSPLASSPLRWQRGDAPRRDGGAPSSPSSPCLSLWISLSPCVPCRPLLFVFGFFPGEGAKVSRFFLFFIIQKPKRRLQVQGESERERHLYEELYGGSKHTGKAT